MVTKAVRMQRKRNDYRQSDEEPLCAPSSAFWRAITLSLFSQAFDDVFWLGNANTLSIVSLLTGCQKRVRLVVLPSLNIVRVFAVSRATGQVTPPHCSCASATGSSSIRNGWLPDIRRFLTCITTYASSWRIHHWQQHLFATFVVLGACIT